MMPANRRYVVAGVVFAALVAVAAGAMLWQDRTGVAVVEPANAAAPAASGVETAQSRALDDATLAQNEAAGAGEEAAEETVAAAPLSEKTLGEADAPVTVIEYASFTCPHCANFHNNILADFTQQFIDSGQVQLVFREFLRNGVDVAISAVARCAPADRYFDVVEAYFSTQDDWLKADQDLRQAILDRAKPFGFSEQSFNACLENRALLAGLDAGMQRAQSEGVTGTPTFFVNGEKHVGALPMEQWKSIIDPMVEGAQQ